MGLRTLRACALVAIGLLCSALAFGQAYPAKPIRFIVPYTPGGLTHLAGELLNAAAGVRTVHVPYKGTAPMLANLLSGRLQFALDTPIMPVRETLVNQGMEAYESTPEQLDALIRSDIDKFAGVVRAANIKLE